MAYFEEKPNVTNAEQLRPVERRVLRWAAAGVSNGEIGRRFGRSEGWVEQVRRLAAVDRPNSSARHHDPLRPLERRLLRWREQGADHDELSARFRRSPGFLERVEAYANFKLASL
jgi:DNA-binding CsgD family transcriptional regulator